MALTTDEAQEFRDSAALMSADELRAMADDPDLKDIIADVLANGKAVEMKQPADLGDDDDAHPNPDDVRVEPKAKPGQDDDDEDDDEDEEAVAAAAAAADDGKGQNDGSTIDAGTHGAEVVEVPPLDLGFLDQAYQQKLADLNAEKADKFQELMDGVIDAREYSTYESQYMERRDALTGDKAAEAQFYTDIHSFKVQAAQADGVNYDADPEKLAAWDDWVKRLAANPANAKLSDKDLLALAHKKVLAEFDLKPGAGAAASGKSAQSGTKTVADGKKVAEKQGRAPNLNNIPPTLGGIPAAATSDGNDDGEFAHLDNLAGMDLERAIARLTPDQRDRWGMM